MVVTAAELAAITYDDMLRLVAKVRAEKPRDPLRALENLLLDRRLKSMR